MQIRTCSHEPHGDCTVSSISEAEYHEHANRTLEDIEVALEDLNDQWNVAERGDMDVSNAQGVLTLKLGDVGTWVLNKQTPNK